MVQSEKQSYSLRGSRGATIRNNRYDSSEEDKTSNNGGKKKVAGRWTDEEKIRFEEGYIMYGKDWKKI